MPNTIPTRKIVRTLEGMGFRLLRQKGSHAFFQHPDGRTTVIPMHPEIHPHLLNKIIKHDLKMKYAEFMQKI